LGALRVLNEHGDAAVAWAVEEEESTALAEAEFDRLRGEGAMAFARQCDASAEEAVLIRSFDPSAAEIIVVRPLAGG